MSIRMDADIDKRQVPCPNTSFIGSGKYKAQVGDLVTYRESDNGPTRIGRMIGRVRYAPPLMDDKGPIENYILVVQLGSELNSVYERWIDPRHVTYIVEPTDQLRVLTYFLGDDIIKADHTEVRKAGRDGFKTLQEAREYQAKRDKDLAEWLERNPSAVVKTGVAK